jgi:hypothetical protein
VHVGNSFLLGRNVCTSLHILYVNVQPMKGSTSAAVKLLPCDCVQVLKTVSYRNAVKDCVYKT